MELRIAIFSDIHANLSGLNAVLADIEVRGGADILVAAGDLVTDGPRPNETFDRLVEAGCLMIRGNHDEHLLGRELGRFKGDKQYMLHQTLWATHQFGAERLNLMEQQPLERIFSPGPGIEGHDLLVVHANLKSVYGWTGHREQAEDALDELYGDAPDSVKIIAFGHWHFYSIRHWRNMKLVNVGSVAYPKDRAKLAGYTFFTWDEPTESWQIEQHRIPFNWREEARLLRECTMPGKPWHLDFYHEDEVIESVA